MSDSDSRSTNDSEFVRFDDAMMIARDQFIQKYGDETKPGFDYKEYRRKLAREKVEMPPNDWMKTEDPVLLRHEELVYRMECQTRQMQRVVRQLESMQDQIENMENKLDTMERSIERTADCVTVIVQEMRSGQLNVRNQNRGNIHNIVE